MCRLTPQMNVTEIAKVAAENGKEPDWGRVMSEIPKVWKWVEKKIQAFILSITGSTDGEKQWLQSST